MISVKGGDHLNPAMVRDLAEVKRGMRGIYQHCKKIPETQAEQSKRFKKDSQGLINAGELNPTDADAVLDKLVTKQRK